MDLTPSLESPLQTPPKRPTVLVIDDEKGLRDLLSFGLGKRDYEVVCASNGEEGLTLARQTQFDLVICDIMMPGVDGVSVLRKIKEISPTTEVIMATGFANLETAVASIKGGAYDYVTKPFSINNLCLILEKALENRRLRKRVDDLEELNKIKTELLSVVSHELRTPMACIMGFVSLLLQGIYGNLTPRQADPLQRTLTSAEQLLLLINNILDLSKLATSRMNLIEDVFDLRELGEEVKGVMSPLVAEKGLTLVLEAKEPLWIRADRSKLKQIIINLIGNSVKFTVQGGRLTLRLLSNPNPTYVVLQVLDTGIGIKPEDQALLFQEFRQVDSSTTRRYGGTGLGLSLVKKMLDLMKGEIHVESEFGSGTTFTIHLPGRTAVPVAESTSSSLSVLAGLGNKKGKSSILCIDDDPMILKLLSDSLQQTDFEVTGALSGAEGLALARKIQPKMITLDIMMPHMDGWSVLHALKDDPELKKIPVFIISIIDNKPLAFSLGVQGYLLKPFTRDKLLETLELALPLPARR